MNFFDDPFKAEFWRKGFHIAGLILIPAAELHRAAVPAILGIALLFYLWAEWARTRHHPPPFFAPLIQRAKRPHTRDHFDLGAIWLAIGVTIPYLFFPLPVAHVALLHVCLADTAASIGGMTYAAREGLERSRRKTWVGSFCFWLVAYLATGFFFPWWQAIVIATAGTGLEAIGRRHIDNLIVPLGVTLFIWILGWA